MARNNYFKHAKLNEHDQETFLMWCLNFLFSDNDVMKSLSQKLIYLFLDRPKTIKPCDIKPSYKKRTIYRQHKDIDIVICFNALDNEYVVILEHKTTSTKGNNLKEYYHRIKNDTFFKDCEIKVCLLDPFKKQTCSNKDWYNPKPAHITSEYCDLLYSFINNSESSPETNFIVDYLQSYFLNLDDDISSASRRFKNICKYLFIDYNPKPKNQYVAIRKDKCELTFHNNGAWRDGEYYLTIEKPNIVINSEVLILVSGKKIKRYIVKGKEKITKVEDIKEVVDIALKEIKNIQES